jgi:hypothetical protein
MLYVDSKGTLWGNQEALNCIKNKVHEIRFDGWMLYPYFIRVFPHVDYYFYYAANCLRGVKMIYCKNYTSVGPNYKMLLENAQPILDYVSTIPFYIEELKKSYANKCRKMSKEDIFIALEITKAKNKVYLLQKFCEMILSS